MPNNIYAIIFGVLLAGCSMQPRLPIEKLNDVGNISLPDGAWQGTVHWRGTKADDSYFRTDGQPFDGEIMVLITSCKNEKKFWMQGEDGEFHSKLVEYKINSYFGNHLIFYQNRSDDLLSPPEWVETQSMLLMELDAKTLRAQWSRSVSNPQLSSTDKERDFFKSGVGTLERTSNSCPVDVLKNIRREKI